MQKKHFAKSDLNSLLSAPRPQGDRNADRLRHALVGHQMIELFSGTMWIGWWLPFGYFIDHVPPERSDQIAPLCVFTAEPGGRWSAAAVIRVVAAAAESAGDGAFDDILRAAGVENLYVTAEEVDRGHHKSDEFAAKLRRAVFGATPAIAGVSHEKEDFVSEPRPIYPPRSQFR